MPCDDTCGRKQTSPSSSTSWVDEPVTIPRSTAIGAVDFMVRHAEDAYDRAMDTYPGAGAWEAFATFARDLHALASAIVEDK